MFYSLEFPELKVDDVYIEFLKRIENSSVNEKDKTELKNFVKLLKENKGENEIDKNTLENNDINISTSQLWKYFNKYTSLKYELPTNGNCPICGLKAFNPQENNDEDNIKKLSIDHVKPKSKYLNYICEPTNLVKICQECNENKDDWGLGEGEDVKDIFNPYIHHYPNMLDHLEVDFFSNDEYRFYYEFILSKQNSDLITSNHHKNYSSIYKVGKSYKLYTEKYLSEKFISPLERIFDQFESKEDLKDFIKMEVNEELNHLKTLTVDDIILEKLLYVILKNIDNFVTRRKEFESFN